MLLDLAPLGSEVAGAILLVLAAVLTIIAKRINAKPDNARQQPHDEIAAVLHRIDESADATRRQMLERMNQHERQVLQVLSSLGDNLARHMREKEIEDRRAMDRLMDRIDRLGHHD